MDDHTADSSIYFSGNINFRASTKVHGSKLVRPMIMRAVRASLAHRPLEHRRSSGPFGGCVPRIIEVRAFGHRYSVHIEHKGHDGVCITHVEDLDRETVTLAIPMIAVRGNQLVSAFNVLVTV